MRHGGDDNSRHSIAWRTHDAQFWGVPQRRRRIALVADFGGESAPEILFERDGVSGDSEACGAAREGAAGTAPDCVGITNRGSVAGVASETLRSDSHGALPMVAKMYALDAVSSNSMRSANPHSGFHEEGVAKTLQAGGVDPTCNQGGNVIVQPVICLQGNGIDRADTAGCNGRGWREDVSYTLNTIDRPAVCYGMTHASDVIRDCGEVSPTLQSRMGTGGNQIPLCIGNGQADQLRCQTRVGALNCMHDQQCVVSTGVVRRLTPLECERLQGFPEIIKADIENMNKDEFIALNLASGQIIADCKNGKVYTTKGPGGIALAKPKELAGTIVNGYRVVSIRNGAVKKQCRVHRVIWIAQNGVIPEGMVVDHINNDKLDNRIENLQLLTPEDNSSKASNDGLYLSGDKSPASVISEQARIEIALWYQTGEFTIRQLAEKYGISKSRVHQIIKAHGWTDIGDWVDTKGKKHKSADAPRYKALGNSIALPFWLWMLRRMSEYLPVGATMGSLFDGVGGFPLCWETIHGAGSARWASEIEEFPIAVTKLRFPEAHYDK